ncbi:MAG TPA: 2-C-methyl-D-erythritol 2,4-cyclodiphosphate synthase [Acidimicrobiia bacterium]
MIRTGWGYDAHRFGGDGPLVLCGVIVASERGLAGTSDGDAAAHALTDAILGASGLGDIGDHFASSDPRWHGADSMDLLGRVAGMAKEAGYTVTSVDVTIVAEAVRIAPHREAMRRRVASVLDLEISHVSVKATTTDGLGFTGRDEGIAAMAVASVAGHGEVT